MNFQLPQRFILPKLEEQIVDVLLDDPKELQLMLPRDRDLGFFKESRAAAAIATLAAGRQLTTIDQHHTWSPEVVERLFAQSLIGFTSWRVSQRVENQKKVVIPADIETTTESIFCSGGILEAPDARGRSITVCAFDPEWGEPPPTANVFTSLETFISAFRELRSLLEPRNLPRKTKAERDHEKNFCELVYELYQNTREHARTDEFGNPINGIRFFGIRRHVGTKESLLMRADGFGEAVDYIKSLPFKGKGMNLWEVSIGDHGMGIVNRFCADQAKLQMTLPFPEDEAKMLNLILTRAVSSKQIRGAGSGLYHALRAIRLLNGFVSLRTGKQWVFGNSSSHEPLEESGLQPVKLGKPLAAIRGTWYNFLFPMLSA